MALHEKVVPISILHQKVYCAGRRLPARTALEVKKKEVPKIASAARVISPCAGTNESDGCTGLMLLSGNSRDYLKRYFFPGQAPQTVVCRNCGEVCSTQQQMGTHMKCQPIISNVLNKLNALGRCVVCDNATDQTKVWLNNRVPLCASSACCAIWSAKNPVNFTIEMASYKARNFGVDSKED